MACFYPLQGYKARQCSQHGKRAVVFSLREGFIDLPVTVPCGQCIGCRLERSRQWAMRCMHEASLHEENAFITLTYDDTQLPEWESLDKRAFPLFMKRLRKAIHPRKVRYFQCGEYGTHTNRPHHHAILFGYDFPDRSLWTTRKGVPVYRSEILERAWPQGLSEVGSVTFESAAYVARYSLKKVTGNAEAVKQAYQVVDPDTGEIGQKEPEFATMSRRPGIGRDWYERFGEEVHPDGVLMRGRLMRPPQYYDRIFEEANPEAFEAERKARKAKLNKADCTPERLSVRETCTKARNALRSRSL